MVCGSYVWVLEVCIMVMVWLDTLRVSCVLNGISLSRTLTAL